MRILMFGLEIANPFKVSIIFFYENHNQFSLEDCVYPISLDKFSLTSGERCAAFPLKKLSEYYDSKADEFKEQKIKFVLEIKSPKLDEVAKDKNVESGVSSDSDN